MSKIDSGEVVSGYPTNYYITIDQLSNCNILTLNAAASLVVTMSVSHVRFVNKRAVGNYIVNYEAIK